MHPTDAELRELLTTAKTIAVLGIKPEDKADQPAHHVPAYLLRQGYTLIPVPVYYPEVVSILGLPVVRSLAAIEQPVDIVNVFRRPKDLPAHLGELLALKPRAVWLQLGIRDDAFAAELEAAGIRVIQDRCIMVEHRALV